MRGHVIVSPNNSGKTTFAQGSAAWTGHDDLFLGETGIGEKKAMTIADMKRADKVTRGHKAMGKNLLVATWYDPSLVDAFVIVPLKTLASRKLTREELEENQRQAAKYKEIAAKYNIRIYTSFVEADAMLRLADETSFNDLTLAQKHD